MTNHVHLLLTPEKAESPALLMKHLGQRYVQYINRVYRRSGTLWEGRFRSDHMPVDENTLRTSEQRTLSVINDVLRRFGRPGLPRFASLFEFPTWYRNWVEFASK